MQILIYFIALLSGLAGLGYQITWSRMFAVGLGHEMPSVLALVTAFFGGLALGSWWLDRPIAISKRPALWYIGIELVIALWVLITIWMLPWMNQFAHQWIGPRPVPIWHWGIAFLIPLLTLLPATFAMGATLPAMDRFAAPFVSDFKMVGGLYGANTLGAVIGTLLSAFWINQTFGYSRSLFIFAALNLVCAVLVAIFFVYRRTIPVFDTDNNPEPVSVESSRINEDSETKRQLIVETDIDPVCTLNRNSEIAWIAFFTGLLGIGYEVVGVRYLGTILNNTIYTYAATLSVFLLGTAIGGLIYQAFLRRGKFYPTLQRLLILMWVACLVGMLAMVAAREIYAYFRSLTNHLVLSEIGVAFAIFAVPTLLMGMLFSHLSQSARRKTGGVGHTIAVNTLGSALAPMIFGVLLIPEIGLKWCLLVICFSYLLLIPAAIKSKKLIGVAFAILFLIVITIDLPTIRVPAGSRLLVEKTGVMATVAIVQTPRFQKGLRVNNHYAMGGTSNPKFEKIQGVLPILLHPRPKSALFLGVGTGITTGSATVDAELRVTGVELVPEVVEVLPFFQPYNRADHRQLEICVGDARRFIRATRDRYDVIVGDLFHPGRDGAGSLYTVEHFRAIADALREGGLACVWLPSYQMDTEVFKMVVRSFLEVFPEATAVAGQLKPTHMAVGLISDSRYLERPEDHFKNRFNPSLDAELLKEVELTDPVQVLGHLLADNRALRDYAGEGNLNLDDLPLVTYLAPRYVYAGYPQRGERFVDLIQIFPDSDRQQIAARLAPPKRQALLDFWRARDRILLW